MESLCWVLSLLAPSRIFMFCICPYCHATVDGVLPDFSCSVKSALSSSNIVTIPDFGLLTCLVERSQPIGVAGIHIELVFMEKTDDIRAAACTSAVHETAAIFIDSTELKIVLYDSYHHLEW